MSYSEKIAYLKGLSEGVGLDESVKEQRLIKVIIEALEELSESLGELEENSSALGGELDEMVRDVSSIEDIIYGMGGFDDDDDDDDDSFEAKCPACGEIIPLGVDEFNAGFVECSKCGEKLEFDFDDDDDDECSCGHHHHHDEDDK